MLAIIYYLNAALGLCAAILMALAGMPLPCFVFVAYALASACIARAFHIWE
jgi:hypothetical protein